jgi:hypothetical protein
MNTILERLESTTPPWVLAPESHWVTLKEFSILYRRSIRRTQQMCQSGEIIVFGVAAYQEPNGRWWIRLPE